MGAGAEDTGPRFDDAEEPLRANRPLTSEGKSATGEAQDSTCDSDAASAPSGPAQAL